MLVLLVLWCTAKHMQVSPGAKVLLKALLIIISYGKHSLNYEINLRNMCHVLCREAQYAAGEY